MQDLTSEVPGPRQMLVVAGSGRSGTSLFTGLPGRLGVHIPQPEVSANRSNPRGFGEPRWPVEFHKELLASVDVVVEDGRPEAWDRTRQAGRGPEGAGPPVDWLEQQFAENDRIVVKDPRLAWFLELHRAASREGGPRTSGSSPCCATRPRRCGRARSRYGTRPPHHPRGRLAEMMLGTEVRTRDLPRATVRYDDLLSDWRPALSPGRRHARDGTARARDATSSSRTPTPWSTRAPSLHAPTGPSSASRPGRRTCAVRTYDTDGRAGRLDADGSAGRPRPSGSTRCGPVAARTTTPSASTSPATRTGALRQRRAQRLRSLSGSAARRCARHRPSTSPVADARRRGGPACGLSELTAAGRRDPEGGAERTGCVRRVAVVLAGASARGSGSTSPSS